LPTFGKTDIGVTGEWWAPGDIIRGCMYTLTEEGYVLSITIYIYSGVPGLHKCAIYDAAGNLRGVTEELELALIGWTWVTFNFPSPILLPAGDYYLCHWSNTDATLKWDTGATNQSGSKAQAYNTFPDPIVWDTYLDRAVSIYATYTTIEYTLTITATTGGTTDPAPGSYTYPERTIVPVTAIPDIDYVLDHWELDGVDVGAPNPISVTMDADHSLHAVFVAVPTSTIQGTVTDAETGEPVAGASVVADAYSTLTDVNGFYSLIVPVGVYTLTISKDGYETLTTTVDASVEGTYTVDVALTPVVVPPPIELTPIAFTVAPVAVGVILMIPPKI